MKKVKNTDAVICMPLLAACQKDARVAEQTNELTLTAARNTSASASLNENTSGYVYTLNNQVSGNKVMVYNRGTKVILVLMRLMQRVAMAVVVDLVTKTPLI